MRKLLALTLTIWLSVFIAATANASQDGGGDGNKVNSWQNNDSELPTAYLPLSLNLETCEPISETELTTTYECVSFVFGTFVVVEPKIESSEDDD